MPLSYSTIRTTALLLPLFYAGQFRAQETRQHRCFDTPHQAKDAVHRLPETARFWLTEDVAYIITPDERCAFLHLETDDERERFITGFWYRRTADSISLNEGTKSEHYRRIAFANEKYGGQIPGWKTDRGRVYVLFGPPDSIDLHPDRRAPSSVPTEDADIDLHPIEEWHYRYIEGIGEWVVFHFEFASISKDYRLADADEQLLAQTTPNPEILPLTPERIEMYVASEPPPQTRFKELEALLDSRTIRDQMNISQSVKFAAATHANTLARIEIRIPYQTWNHEGSIASSPAYPLFVRITKPPARFATTLELTADTIAHDGSESGLALLGHLDVALKPGTYQIAIAGKNPRSGAEGVLITELNVPDYESLSATN
jgi:GWxTD domain-containing protein